MTTYDVAAPLPVNAESDLGSDSDVEWVAVCRLVQIGRESGVAALVRGEAVAVVRDHADQIFALSNVDPASGASVLARGIVGTRRGVPFVASPMHKQQFGLSDGISLDDPSLRVATYGVRVLDGVVFIGPRTHTEVLGTG